MSTRVVFDLDLEDLDSVYRDALDTIAYLNDVVKSISTRVLEGEHIKGLEIVEGKKTRVITPAGEKYLTTMLGKSNMYKEKLIGITELEKLVSKQDMAYLESNGYIDFNVGKSKVVNVKEKE